jgi:hypothetical protein
MLEMSPPMTTVASGFWTSAPVPVAMAIGTKPREATSAVINTGRKHVSAPRKMASSRAIAAKNDAVEVCIEIPRF